MTTTPAQPMHDTPTDPGLHIPTVSAVMLHGWLPTTLIKALTPADQVQRKQAITDFLLGGLDEAATPTDRREAEHGLKATARPYAKRGLSLFWRLIVLDPSASLVRAASAAQSFKGRTEEEWTELVGPFYLAARYMPALVDIGESGVPSWHLTLPEGGRLAAMKPDEQQIIGEFRAWLAFPGSRKIMNHLVEWNNDLPFRTFAAE